MGTAYIGIGSNIGDREGNCLRAIGLMQERGLQVSERSRVYETEPWGVKEQPRFINMVVSVITDLPPQELLAILKGIEKQMGRTETARYGPRLIDLDILIYGSLVLKEQGLEIPHPLMQERDFVLAPFAEIAPETVHPVIRKTIREIWAEFKGDG